MTKKEYLNYVKENDDLQKSYLSSIGLILLSIKNKWEDKKSVDVRLKLSLSISYLISYNCSSLKNELQGEDYVEKLRKQIMYFRERLLKRKKQDGDFFIDWGDFFEDNFPYGYIGILPENFGELEEEYE